MRGSRVAADGPARGRPGTGRRYANRPARQGRIGAPRLRRSPPELAPVTFATRAPPCCTRDVDRAKTALFLPPSAFAPASSRQVAGCRRTGRPLPFLGYP
ncbi:hypothetical protein LG3211_0478 [Lysobacter gummosus]|nr:hypothetical protein LG3211_0478 [Lysobacter gummosus]